MCLLPWIAPGIRALRLKSAAALLPPLGIDIHGGAEFRYRLRVDRLPTGVSAGDATDRAIDVIRRRIDPQGTADIKIRATETHEILIEVPGQHLSKIDEIEERLKKVGRLEARIANSQPAKYERADRIGLKFGELLDEKFKKVPLDPAAHKIIDRYDFALIDWSGERGDAWMTGDRIVSAVPSLSMGLADRHPWIVRVKLDSVGKYEMGRVTKGKIGKQMAIVLDGVCRTAPVLKAELDEGEFIIEGLADEKECRRIAGVLNSGALPAELELEHKNLISPDIGASARDRGILATVLAFVLVVLFFGAYYRGVGWVANFALALNLALTVGLLSSLEAVLTLPGIAGLILTLGMALDANVLIFERIREERAKGRTISLALKNGYERAWSAILDSNLTTIITALIFWLIGTGPVKGFGVTLTLGLAISMFTSVAVTRAIYETLVEAGIVRTFSMSGLLKPTRIDFLRWMKPACVASVVVILAGLGNFVRLGPEKLDIDFRGGHEVYFVTARPLPDDDVRRKLETGSGLKDVKVQGIHRLGEKGQEAESLAATASARAFREFKIAVPDIGQSNPDRVEEYLRTEFARRVFPAADPAKGQAQVPTRLPEALDARRREGGAWLGFVFPSEVGRDAFLEAFQAAGGDGAGVWPAAALPASPSPPEGAPARSAAWGGFLTRAGYRRALDGFFRWAIRAELPDLVPEAFPKEPAWTVRPRAGGGDPEKVLDLWAEFDPFADAPVPAARIAEVLKAWGARNPEVASDPPSWKPPAGAPAGAAGPVRIRLAEADVKAVVEVGRDAHNVAPDPQRDDKWNLQAALRDAFGTGLSNPFPRIGFVGSEVASELREQALFAMAGSLVAMLLYLWFRFLEVRYGFAAIVALFHDALVAFGVTAAANALGLVDGKVNLPHVAAILTIIGYSVNDTIVIFDRIRENLQALRRDPNAAIPREAYAALVNDALNQTLPRTILTSLTVFMTVLILFFVGRGEGSVLEGFAFTMIAGTIAGTYSTVYIAVPLLVSLHRGGPRKRP